jgi:hypothetical protein
MAANDPFDLKFTSREVTAWGGLALLKRMLDGLDFKAALRDLKRFCRINCERTRFSSWTLHHPYAGRICPASA